MAVMHRAGFPVAQLLQLPHGDTQERTTRSPTCTVDGPGPTAVTIPAPSWPQMIGRFTGIWPCTMCRSLWQTPLDTIFTDTSLALGACTSTSWTTNGVLNS